MNNWIQWTQWLVAQPFLNRWPLEVGVVSMVCLGLAGLVAARFGQRSAAFRAQLWLMGFATIGIWMSARLSGITVALPIWPAIAPATAAVPANVGPMAPPLPVLTAPRRVPSAPPPKFQEMTLDRPPLPATPVPTRAPAPAKTFQPAQVLLVVGLIWAGGCLVLLGRIAAGLMVLRNRARRARSLPPDGAIAKALAGICLGKQSGTQVCLDDGVGAPLSFGLRRRWILFPPEAEQWSPARLRMVLAHELAHGERRDHLALLLIQIVTAVCWLQPLAWMGLRRFRLLCESAADDRTLEQVDAPTYAGELLELVRTFQGRSPLLATAALSIGQPSTLRHRVAALLDAGQDRRRLSRRTSWGMAATALLLAAFLPNLRVVHAQTPAASPPAAAPATSRPSAKSLTEIKELTIMVRDQKGNPIKGAVITPTGGRANHDLGSWFGWNSVAPKDSVQTDELGWATLSYPAYLVEDLETRGITAEVTHPDFCAEPSEISVTKPLPVVLKRGAKITLRAQALAGTEGELNVFANVVSSGNSFVWAPMRSQGESVAGRTPAGDYIVRVVAFDGQERRYFGEPTHVHLVEDEDQELTLPVQLGAAIKGQLAAEVPRPVAHGRVMLSILSPVPGLPEEKCTWDLWAPVLADGTFALRDVPKGTIRLLALCDGYVSREPLEAKKGLACSPQQFDFSSAEQIIVPMEKTGTARITVLKPDGQPLSGATVGFFPNQIFDGGTRILGTEFDQGIFLRRLQTEVTHNFGRDIVTPPWRAVTNEAGVAEVSNLPASLQSYVVEAEGLELPVTTPQRTGMRDAKVEIKGGEVTEAKIKLEPKGTISLSDVLASAASISPGGETRQTGVPFPVTAGKDFVGRVVDEAGKPLAGVLVDAWTWCPGSETKTDVDGRFRLAEPGDEDGRAIEVIFRQEGFSPVHVTRQLVGTVRKDIVLSQRPYFEGTLTDSLGRPVADQLVRATCGEKEADGVSIGDIWCETRSDAQGHYRLHVFPSTYQIEVRTAQGEVARLAGLAIQKNETRVQDIALAPGVVFRAKVVDATTGDPVAGVHFSHMLRPGIEGTSDEHGEVTISGMSPGDFKFEIEAEKQGYRRWWSPVAVNEWERRQIKESGWQDNFDNLQFTIVKDGPPVRIEMEKGVKMRGIVRDPKNQPVAGATVAPARTGSGNSLTGDTRFSVVSGKDGRFEMLLPASGTVSYNLVAHDGGYEQWRGLANGVLPPIQTKPGQEIEGVEIVLTSPCIVRGKAVDEAGRAVANREVRAAPSDALESRYYFPTTRTQADGSFELRFVRAGKQQIQVAPFWLDPKEAPKGSTVEVEASTEHAVEDVKLTATTAE